MKIFKFLLLTIFLNLPLNSAELNDTLLNNVSNDVAKNIPDTKTITPSTYSSISPDSINFWEKLNSGILDNLCKQAKIRLNRDADLGNIAGIDGSFNRWFERYPDKSLALIDEVGIKLDSSFGTELLNVPNIGSLNVSIGGSVEGKSIIVRPLGNDDYCKNLKLLVNLKKVKTILPLNEKRIEEMQVGEIWKVPLYTRFSFSGSFGGSPIPYLVFSIGGGYSKERTPSVTLYRMDKDIIRLRIRIERITVKSVGVSASTTYEIAPADIGLFEAENIITKLVNKEIAKQINKYIAFKIGYSKSKSKSKKILLEFLIDVNNKEQISSLVEFLKGDLGIISKLIKLGLKFNEFDEDLNYNAGMQSLNNVTNQAAEQLNAKPSYAGTNHSHSSASNINVTVPIIHSHNWTNNNSYNRYQSLDGKEVIHIHHAQRVSEGSTLNIPFLGTLSKYREEENTLGINKEDSQKMNDFLFLYQYNAGFVRNSEDSARSMIDKANGILKYVSMDGEGTSSEYTINSESIFPKTPENDRYDPYDSTARANQKTYKRAMIAFNLLISKEGIKQIVFSTPQRILKAYLNMMKEFDEYIVKKFYSLFRVEGEKVVVDTKGIRYDEEYNNTVGILEQMAHTATKLIKDIFSIRDESDPKKQSEKFVAISSGKGESGLKYDKFMKVIVQLVSKENMAGNIYITTDKEVKGEQDVNANYQIDPNNELSNNMKEITELRDRFSTPSTLKD